MTINGGKGKRRIPERSGKLCSRNSKKNTVYKQEDSKAWGALKL